MKQRNLGHSRGLSFGLLIVLQIATVNEPLAQGVVLFNNRVAGVADARVTFIGPGFEQGVGAGFTSQLFGGPEGTAVGNLTALLPTTTFRTSSAAAQGYVNPVVVQVPGIASGNKATLQMRVLDAAGSLVASSFPFIVTLGGDILPPANLEGLQSFAIIIPEPSTLSLFVAGGLVCLISLRKLRSCAIAPRGTLATANRQESP